jgi:hypothetical protein
MYSSLSFFVPNAPEDKIAEFSASGRPGTLWGPIWTKKLDDLVLGRVWSKKLDQAVEPGVLACLLAG